MILYSQEIVYKNDDPIHEPTLYVVFRGPRWELVRSDSYYKEFADRFGHYQIRQKAGVHLRNRETGQLDRLYNGTFSYRRLATHNRFGEVAKLLGVSTSELLESCGRQRSAILEASPVTVGVASN